MDIIQIQERGCIDGRYLGQNDCYFTRILQPFIMLQQDSVQTEIKRIDFAFYVSRIS